MILQGSIHKRFSVLFVMLLLTMMACHHQKKVPANKVPAKAKPKDNVSSNTRPANDLKGILKISDKDIKENNLYRFSNEWYGTPYQYGGCSKSGVDCSCFTALLYQQVYHHTLARSTGDIFKSCDEISRGDARQGDLVFFKIGGHNISHVGVLLKGSMFIHASTSKGVMVSSLDEAYFKKYFFCAGKIKKA